MEEIIIALMTGKEIKVTCDNGNCRKIFDALGFREYAGRNSVSRVSFVAFNMQDYKILDAYTQDVDRIVRIRETKRGRNRN